MLYLIQVAIVLHSLMDKTSPTFLTDAASSAKITTFRNQKKYTASRDIVSILREITSK